MPRTRPRGRCRPRQAIIDNLEGRITEAEQHGWLGDVEGLRVTLNSAELKLAQTYKLQSHHDRGVVALGTPTLKDTKETRDP